MVGFIYDRREQSGVEPMCAVLPIAPSTYCRDRAAQTDPTRRSRRAQRDAERRDAIQCAWDKHYQVHGSRNMRQRLRRQGIHVARCTVRRLMRAMGLQGAVRGRAWVTTTQPAITEERPSDLVERDVTANRPNPLWVADFTYVATWLGFVYLVFAIDVVARRIVGWRVSTSLRADFVLGALEQAIYDGRGGTLGGLVRQSDRGTQYLSMRYRDRLVDADIAPSVSSQGDSCDNALGESVIELFKTKVIQRRGPCRGWSP